MLLRMSLIAACCVLLHATGAAAEIYEWRNDDGITGFTDDIAKVPPKYKKSLKKEGTGDYSVNVTESSKDAPKRKISASVEERRNELTDEQKEEADKQIKATWQHMKDSLKKRKRHRAEKAADGTPD